VAHPAQDGADDDQGESDEDLPPPGAVAPTVAVAVEAEART